MTPLELGLFWVWMVGTLGVWLAAIRILRERDPDEGVMRWIYAMVFIAGVSWPIWIWVPILSVLLAYLRARKGGA